jgi:hypothetical protein
MLPERMAPLRRNGLPREASQAHHCLNALDSSVTLMMPSPDPLCAFALGLTTLLALGADQSAGANSGASPPAWLPLAALGLFALGSSVLGVIDPESFALAFAGP